MKTKDKSKKTKVMAVAGYWVLVRRSERQQATSNKQQATSNQNLAPALDDLFS